MINLTSSKNFRPNLSLSLHQIISRSWNFEAKGGFYSESAMRFLDLQYSNIPKNYPELEI